MDKWFRICFGLALMGIALMLLAGQVMLVVENGFEGKEGMTLAGFVFGSFIFIAAAVLLFMLGLKIFRKRTKKYEGENLLDDSQTEREPEEE